eukprot:CAMPEP_0175786330 /NCGR_PEP_ID=MMETSP0097-20121207/79784_1 /TAXON_ID=311494 /ORGANISM="Alexandrium monilatum, Strain CCMP3105" /LENGTH=324 /DNA_ID=CAMNT_0017097261 /DNA_START=43 /DNA_END=1012 /DNA_ORIENTATION=+
MAGATAPGGLRGLLQGIRPTLPGGMALPGGLALPTGTGVAPGLGALEGLGLPKLGMDAKAAIPSLLSLSGPAVGSPMDAKAGVPPLGLLGGDMAKAKPPMLNHDLKMPPPRVLPPALNMPGPGMSGPGMMPPPIGDVAMMPKTGSMPPMSVPGMAGMTKAPGGGMPAGGGMPGGLPAGPPGGLPGGPGGPMGLLGRCGSPSDMVLPPMDLPPKVQSKSQMPSMSMPMPKLMGGPGMLPPGVGAPMASEAVAAATAKAAAGLSNGHGAVWSIGDEDGALARSWARMATSARARQCDCKPPITYFLPACVSACVSGSVASSEALDA